ncbi:hypothetical protein [Methylobacterium oryzihabitans]|uniref:Uncharacterized protein n=1 Tax=Methylobacterium oryzihabitans TaxID=2499852 RepID=A0A3S2V8C9_9HYPH|nr:hypothetical protein [Methylobacterium oryzihabitans]RVU18170.1 hypothetical protein EOE48_12360 [Methylobacterium oryzihabitans]
MTAAGIGRPAEYRLLAGLCLAGAAAAHSGLDADWAEGPVAAGLAAGAAVALVAGIGLCLAFLVPRPRGAAARGAAVLLPLAGLALGLVLLPTCYADLSRNLAQVLAADEAMEAASVVLGPHGRDVRLSGDFAEGTAARLAAILAAHPEVVRLHLTSDGGLVEEGMAVGDLVAARGLTTYVPDYCVSACTLAFMRGRERLILRDSHLGFHAPYEPGLFGEKLAVDSSGERRAYLSAGLTPDFVDRVLSTPSRDVWFPDAERLKQVGAITATVAPDRMPDSTLDDDPTLAGARAAVLRAVALMGAFREQAPDALDAVAAPYLDAYRQGLSEPDGEEIIRAGAARQIGAALARGGDDLALEFGRLIGAAMAAARDEEDCMALGRDGDAVLAADTLAPSDPGAPARLRALLDRALAGRRFVPPPGPARSGGLLVQARHRGCADLRRRYDAALARRDVAALRPLLFGAVPAQPALEATAAPARP